MRAVQNRAAPPSFRGTCGFPLPPRKAGGIDAAAALRKLDRSHISYTRDIQCELANGSRAPHRVPPVTALMVYDRREYLNKAFQPADDEESLQSLPQTRTTATSESGQRGHAAKDGRNAAESVRPLGAGRDKRKAGASTNTSTNSGDAKAKRPVA